MRENSRFEMMRAVCVGAKAVTSVEMAVPPTMVAGELNVEISEGETSGDDFSDGDIILRTSTNNNHTEWFQTKRRVDQRRQAIK
jgi:hypothetical protein